MTTGPAGGGGQSGRARVETARSLLFVPGDRPDRYAKAAASGADLVVVDLEDAVAPTGRADARRSVAGWLGAGGRAVVRVNATGTPDHRVDVAALVGLAGLVAVMVPKAQDPVALSHLAAHVGAQVGVVALVETARGLERVRDLARAGGVRRLAFGQLDFAADIGSSTSSVALLHARSALVVASRSAGLPGPVDGPCVDLAAAAAATQAAAAAELGFTGALCIHPVQVGEVNAAFAPTPEQLRWARRIVGALTDGGGVARVDGAMVDAPVVRRARALLERAGEQS